MNQFFSFLAIISLSFNFHCSQKINNGVSYKINQYFSGQKDLKQPINGTKAQFFSYENFLFEIITEQNFITNYTEQKNLLNKDSSIVKLKCVYVFKKNDSVGFQISEFSKNFEVQKDFPINKKEFGIKIGQEDEMMKACFQSFLNNAKKDTIINNDQLKYNDTSFIFNKSTSIVTTYYYKENSSTNTLFSFNKKSILFNSPYLFWGMESIINNKNYMGIIFEDVTPLTKNEEDICKTIIDQIYKRKVN